MSTVQCEEFTFPGCAAGDHAECYVEYEAYGFLIGRCDCECHNPVDEPKPHMWSWSELAIMNSAEMPCRCEPGVRDTENVAQSALCPPCWARVYLIEIHEKGERAFNT